MRRQEILETLANLLGEESNRRCKRGGSQPYPDDTAVVDDHVVVATLDAGKEYSSPQLEIYPLAMAKEWLRRIREEVGGAHPLEFKSEDDDLSAAWNEALEEAINECKPAIEEYA